MTEASIVEYTAEHEGYRCGYCHSSNTNYSHGMWAHQMAVEDYQDLIDRGWRRSGKYVYKPTMNRTCCPQYPIRCNVTNVRLTKSHKKVIKRVNRYLSYGERQTVPAADQETHGRDELPSAAAGCRPVTDDVKAAVASSSTAHSGSIVAQVSQATAPTMCEKKVLHKTPKPGVGLDPAKPPPKKAKQLRLERRLAKRAQSGASRECGALPAKKKSEFKSLEDYLNSVVEKPVHKLELQLIRSSPRNREFDEKFSASHLVYHKYQTAIHDDPPSKPNEKQFTRFLVDSPLTEVTLLHSEESTSSESYKESYALFQKYQMNIHKEPASDCTQSDFENFLIESPLSEVSSSDGDDARPPHGYGSFHQHYVLDGKIIAVGVIDILPRCVSSVYLYYDPQYSFLTLGTYSALRELAFTRHLNRIVPQISYYYLGFYIHSCPKMRYKGQYAPSYLCCPETFTWHPLAECEPKLDASNYSRFAAPDAEDEDRVTEIDDVLCLHKQTVLPYSIYVQLKRAERKRDPTDAEEVKQYAGFVGAKCARRMLLYRR